MQWDQFIVIIGTAAINFAVSWGAFRVQMNWMRADVDRAHQRIDAIARHLGQVDT